MTTTVVASPFSAEAFEAFLATRREPGWLTDQRRAAWSTFQQMEFPSRREEEWMRTDIRLFKLDKFALVDSRPAGSLPPVGVLSTGLELAGSVVTVNGRPVHSRLDETLQRKGVLFGCLEELAATHEDLVRPNLLTRAVRPDLDKFAALHAACWSGGTLLYVPRGVVIEQPLHTLSALLGGAADYGHLLVVLEEGASATILAETAGDDSPGFHAGAMELLLGPGSRLRFVNLQNWGKNTWHFAHNKAIVDRGSSLQWTIGALGSRLANVNQHVELVGRDADVQVNGVMFTEGRQHLSYHTLQHHRAEACRSDLLYKGALQDESRVVWRGMIRVAPKAQRTDAYQRNDNLILSVGARADSIPGLEIEADDVRCTHGSTTGRVDDTQVFYARCRGLTRKEAVRMIVAGYFQQVFDRITLESVRNSLGEAIGRRIREYD